MGVGELIQTLWTLHEVGEGDGSVITWQLDWEGVEELIRGSVLTEEGGPLLLAVATFSSSLLFELSPHGAVSADVAWFIAHPANCVILQLLQSSSVGFTISLFLVSSALPRSLRSPGRLPWTKEFTLN